MQLFSERWKPGTVFLLCVLMIWVSFSVGCSDVEPTVVVSEAEPSDSSLVPDISSSETAIPTPTPTSVPLTPAPLGMSRSAPEAPDVVVSAPNWDVQVMQVIRGEEALGMVQDANMFNEPPASGGEYLLISICVTNTASGEDTRSICEYDFRVTGANHIVYRPASVVEPEPGLDAELFSGGSATGWAVFEVGLEEPNLILVVDERFSLDDDYRRYISLSEGAFVNAPESCEAYTNNSADAARSSPIPFGETLVTDEWAVTAVELVRGDEALGMIREANSFNDPPETGMEYVLVKMHVVCLASAGHWSDMDWTYYDLTGEDGVVYDNPSVVDPTPELECDLFPGGEYEGWVTLQCREGEQGLMLIFDEPFSLFEGPSYMSLGN